MKNLDNIKKQTCYFANKGQYSQNYGFSSGHVWTWDLDHKEGWALKNWCFWTVVLKKTLESSLDCKEIQSVHVHPNGNQSWIFIGRTDAEAETLVLWPLIWRTDSLEKTLMLGKIEGGRIRGWQGMRWLDGITDVVDMSLSRLRELVKGQGSLACCSPWGRKEVDTTEQLNWTEWSSLLDNLSPQRLISGCILKQAEKASH